MRLTTCIILSFILIPNIYPNEINNGAFNSLSGWQKFTIAGNLQTSISRQGNESSIVFSGSGFCNGGIYQQVNLVKGNIYQLDGRSRDLGSGADGAWAEVFIGKERPQNNMEYNDNMMVGFSTYGDGCKGWNTTFTNGCKGNRTTFTPTVSDIYYLVIKVGAGDNCDVRVEFDELKLISNNPQVRTNRPSQSTGVINGTFENGLNGWTTWRQTGLFEATTQQNVNPSSGGGGSGLVLNVGLNVGDDFSNGGVYQQVSLQKGVEYTINGFARNIDVPKDTGWLEIYLGNAIPAPGEDYNGQKIAVFSTFAAGCGLFDSDFMNSCDQRAQPFSLSGSGNVTKYLLIKAGISNVNPGRTYSFCLDNIEITSTNNEGIKQVERHNTNKPITWQVYNDAEFQNALNRLGQAVIYVRSQTNNNCLMFEKEWLLTDRAKKYISGTTIFYADVDLHPDLVKKLNVIRVPVIHIYQSNGTKSEVVPDKKNEYDDVDKAFSIVFN